jgi:hypothetical protein
MTLELVRLNNGRHRESPGISDGKGNQLIKKLHSAWVFEQLLQILFKRTSSSVMFLCVYTMSYFIRWVQFLQLKLCEYLISSFIQISSGHSLIIKLIFIRLFRTI